MDGGSEDGVDVGGVDCADASGFGGGELQSQPMVFYFSSSRLWLCLDCSLVSVAVAANFCSAQSELAERIIVRTGQTLSPTEDIQLHENVNFSMNSFNLFMIRRLAIDLITQVLV